MSKEELINLSSAQRAELFAAADPIVRKAAAVDRVVAYVRRYPVLTSVVVGAVALAGPRRIFDMGSRALAVYALLRR